LQEGLSGGNFENAPTAGMDQTSDRYRFGRTTLLFRSVHEIKVAVALKQKRNRSTEITRQAKIVFSPIDRSDLSKKGHAFVREDKLVGMDLEFMIGDGAGSFPGKVEIRVLSKAKRGRPIANSIGFDQENIALRNTISNGHVHYAWVTLLAIAASISKP
jgi:hypothetical protein